ncbi:hypothetical protein VTN49DRAFT_4878 [Thermomyces lanuginosus]|uniref:uncharacterized protein n=1 Tax=Thermomyces lanuginosus TaxID=5541 RepID=UPI0037432C21
MTELRDLETFNSKRSKESQPFQHSRLTATGRRLTAVTLALVGALACLSKCQSVNQLVKSLMSEPGVDSDFRLVTSPGFVRGKNSLDAIRGERSSDAF